MEIEYIVVSNNQKSGEAAASRLIEKLANGYEIITVTPTKDCVHYIIKDYKIHGENLSPEDEKILETIIKESEKKK